VRRSEVWWANYPPGQRHPVLLLSWDAHGDWRDQVTVAEVTRIRRGIDAEVGLGPADGMPGPCFANLDALATINRSRLASFICQLGPDRMAEVEIAVHHALGMDVPCCVGEV
jgi:mRNA-degrading endonuclease toxin of MazEF toxin-antitoxin module